jgi:DNA end-binding protein Ku
MPARATWSGQLRLALVSIPVEIYPATRGGARIALNQIHKPSGKRIKLEKTVPGIGPVEDEDIVKGYELAKGDYVLLEDEELDEVRLESRKTFELVQFVDAGGIDPIYFEKPYYVVPADELAEEAFGVIRDALKQTKKVGLGQLAMRGNEYLCSLKPCGRGMVLETLRYADEVNSASPFFRGIPQAEPPGELLDLATTLIDKRSAPFDPERFHDHYKEALKALIDSKRGRQPLPAEEPEQKPSNVVDLMAALKASIEKGGKGESAPAKKPAAKKPAARKAAAKPAPRRAKRA